MGEDLVHLLVARRQRLDRLQRRGFAVRVDWPDGSHRLFGWRRGWHQAWRLVQRDKWYWRGGPARPFTWSIVVVTRADLRVHASRGWCGSTRCPSGAVVARRGG
jgi:hypothetical protein